MAQKPARKQTKKLATATKEISSYSGTRRHANEVRCAKMSTIHLHTICMGGERLSITVDPFSPSSHIIFPIFWQLHATRLIRGLNFLYSSVEDLNDCGLLSQSFQYRLTVLAWICCVSFIGYIA